MDARVTCLPLLLMIAILLSPTTSTNSSSSPEPEYLTGTPVDVTDAPNPKKEEESVQRRPRSQEQRIKETLLKGYDKTSRPVHNDSTAVNVSVGMSLFHILDTNEKFQTLQSLISIRLGWKDEYLSWKKEDYENVSRIWIPSSRIWVPDILISNYADDSFNDMMSTNTFIDHDGKVMWMYPAVSKTYCTLNVRYFPFDQQYCNITFYSWTYTGSQVDLKKAGDASKIYFNTTNQEWFVDRITVVRNVVRYVCCTESFPDVTFTIHMHRRSLFYVVNLIFPCLLIYAVAFLGFFLPVESGEKVNLEITILLALVVFLLIAGETLPPTPDAIPVLGMLYGVTMLMVSLALIMAVIVTNLYLRKNSAQTVPLLVRRFFRPCSGLPPRAAYSPRKAAHSARVAERLIAQSRRAKFTTDVTSPLANHLNTALHGTDTYSLQSCEVGNQRGSLDLHAATEETHNSTDPACDWEKVAKTVDRIFFWVFLALSITIMTCLFGQIPSVS